jgi:hypothetical protein
LSRRKVKRRECDAAQAWRMQTSWGRRWEKAEACCGTSRKGVVAEEDRWKLQQSQRMFLVTRLVDAMAKHASRIAFAACGATAGRVVRKGSTRHVHRGGRRGGV